MLTLPTLIALIAVLFLGWSVAVQWGMTLGMDHAIMRWMHHHRTPMGDLFFRSVTWLGSLWVILSGYMLLMLVAYDRITERGLGLGLMGVIVSSYAIKFWLHRPRPRWFETLYELPLDPSYPSAHTAQIVLWMGMLWILWEPSWWMGALMLLVVVSVALSRIYLQVHYPSDVIAGALLGVLWILIMMEVTR